VLAAMTAIFLVLLFVAVLAEQNGNSGLCQNGRRSNRPATYRRAATWKAKRRALGIVNSALWATATTGASNGSVNSMLDSFTPLGGLVPLWHIQLGEIIYGGVGFWLVRDAGLRHCGRLVAGLMVGRTPEYLGKKIEAYEMKMSSLVILIPPLFHPGRDSSCGHGASRESRAVEPWPPRLQRDPVRLYVCHRQQRQCFRRDQRQYTVLQHCTRHLHVLRAVLDQNPVLALAGSLARKKIVPASAGTLPTHTPLFIVMLIGVVIIVGALAFLPALALGQSSSICSW